MEQEPNAASLLPETDHSTFTSWREQIKRISPEWIRQLVRQLRALRRHLHVILHYSGKSRYCPVCGHSSSHFESFTVHGKLTEDVQCPWCFSHERHRFLWPFLPLKTDLFSNQPNRAMLHIAPESFFEPRLRSQIGAGYLTADLIFPADVKMDVMNIHYPDESFDIIYCSHVLQYVPDDLKALREFHRVLKKSGWAIIMVPFTAQDHTFSDPSFRLSDDLRFLGSQDFVIRRYGPDFPRRLEEAGFHVTTYTPADLFSPAEVIRFGLTNRGTGSIYYCTK